MSPKGSPLNLICSRTNENCKNRELTIFDTNMFVNILNCYYDSGSNTFDRLMNKFSDYFNKICNFCIVNKKLYVSQSVADNELNPYTNSAIGNSLIFQNDDKQIYREILHCLLEKIIEVGELTNQEEMHELKYESNNYVRINQLDNISLSDISIFYLALQMSNNIQKPIIIVTQDISLYRFMEYCNRYETISLGGKRFNTELTVPITILQYLIKSYECCIFNDFEKFHEFIPKHYAGVTNLEIAQFAYQNFLRMGREFHKIEKRKYRRVNGGGSNT